MSPIPYHRFSELVADIYDCTIEPDRWPNAMREICIDLRCMGSTILLADLQHSHVEFLKTWNFDAGDAILRDQGYMEDVMFYLRQPAFMALPVDEPAASSRLLSHIPMDITRYDREISRPRGSIDALHTVIGRNGCRIGYFAAIRHESVGFATDEDLSVLRLLAPHIRRAITISDLMDLKVLEASALAATLDRLTMGVAIVAGENRILHANEAARHMFSEGGPIVSRQGRLAVRDNAADEQLTKAIEIAQRDEAHIGATGLGLALVSPTAEPALAHVLPLAQGDVRSRLMPQATAAVFVTAPKTRPSFDRDALAQAYDLTSAETGILERLAAGATLDGMATALGISVTTVKTHLARIFAKTGVSRQADLIALVHRLSPPVR